jgi:GWxTD domain-containing protein
LICSAATPSRLAGLVLLLLIGAQACSSGPAARSAADLTNPFLGPELSSWLIGPIARIATPEEVQAFLTLQDNAQAEAFVRQFWAKRDANPEKPGNPLEEAFQERAAEADRLYTEAGFRGRRTDRGTIYVLYGPPTKTDFEVSPTPRDSPIEVWTYSGTTPAGLDGKRPAAAYRFIKSGDLTVTYMPGQDPRLRRPATTDPEIP